MQVQNALASKSIRRFKEASKTYMAEWFREFLRTHPSKKLAANNYLAPLKQFMKHMKNELRKMRPAGASGVAEGNWKLPCKLKSAKAWAFLEKQFAQLRIHMMPAVRDTAPKHVVPKGSFQIVPSQPKLPVNDDVPRRKRKPVSSTTFMRVGEMILPVINSEAFLRRPRDEVWKSLHEKVAKAPTNRREKRGQTKPNARCL